MKNLVVKQHISFLLFLSVSFLFLYKYLDRYTEYAGVFSVLFCGVYILFWKKKEWFRIIPTYVELVLMVGFVLVSFLMWKKFPVETLNVDRWSVISSFWDSYFRGEYAYFAKSNVGNPPGPMPFYFLLALPFYLFGELGVLAVMGVLLMYGLLLLLRVQKEIRMLILLLMISSGFTIWEVISRSNIFLNTVLVLASLLYILGRKEFNLRSVLISGIMVGLLVSTRNVFVISYMICFLFLWRTGVIKFKQLVLLGGIGLIVFGLTFIPIVYGHWDDFERMNPFIVQSTFLIPFEYTLFFAGLAVTASFLCKFRNDVYFYNALVLFVSILIYMLYHIYNSGFYDAFTGSTVDISYFIFCIPFALWMLTVENTKSLSE